MLAYIVRRLGVLGVILFGSSFILFNMAAIAGDPIGELRLSNDRRHSKRSLISQIDSASMFRLHFVTSFGSKAF